MAHHLDEEETVEALKSFWGRYGKWCLIGLSALIIGYLGQIAYQQYQTNRAYKAADLYIALESALNENDFEKTQSITQSLMNDYADTAYASRAALLIAKFDFLFNQIPLAKTKLRWVIENSHEPALRTLAQIRLATLLFDQKSYKEALVTIDEIEDENFLAQSFELKGDILRATGDIKSAKIAYQKAMRHLAKEAPNRFLLNVKLNESY